MAHKNDRIFCPKQKEICEEKIKSLTKVSFSLNRQTCEAIVILAGFTTQQQSNIPKYFVLHTLMSMVKMITQRIL